MEQQPKKKSKKYLTLFFILIPSLLLAMYASVDNIYVRISLQVVTLLLQYVLVKNLLDEYYLDDE